MSKNQQKFKKHRVKWNFKTFKNVRRMKTLAKQFNKYMNALLKEGIITEFSNENCFELFAAHTAQGVVLGMRPQGLRYQPYWIPVHKHK